MQDLAVMNPFGRPPIHINDLPVELLRIIMEEATPFLNFSDLEYGSPMSILGVCRKWRDILITFPKLWYNFLIMNSPEDDPLDPMLSEDNIRTWVGRSQSRPLKILIYTVRKSDNLQAAVRHFITHASRKIGSLSICSRAPLASDDFYVSLDCPEELPCLEQVSIFFENREEGRGWWAKLVHNAVALRNLTWCMCPGYLQWTRLSQLTRVELIWPLCPSQALHILECIPGLLEFVIDLHAYGGIRLAMLHPSVPDIPEASRGIHLVHHLRSLRIYTTSQVRLDIRHFIKSLTLPSLTELEFASRSRDQAKVWSQDHILSLLNRSSCTLRRLKLFSMDLTEEEAIELLRLDSMRLSLEELIISQKVTAVPSPQVPIVGEKFLKFLTVPDEPTSSHTRTTSLMLPHLRRLVLSNTLGDDTDIALLKMVNSRYPTAKHGVDTFERLLLVKKRSDDDIAEEQEPEAVELIKQVGFDLTLRDGFDWYCVESNGVPTTPILETMREMTGQ
ncbi:hypothetical protein D9758_003388 [Tetrapyrgos nigripes]|uniref:F-box domain-containing protein n=1 Tax=Tetrapyrgos nigripes TaxID=182062 RepID=A0A8H5GV49_9AGAR|nr:hypothetical protein D9758_003388 [Tetrapyrgos nigripes]